MKGILAEAWARIWKWAVGWCRGGPHFIVGSPTDPYLLRWYILPRNPLLNIYLHQFLRDDDDRALHDHPWASLSILLAGTYREITPGGSRQVWPGAVIFRRATHAHRIELPGGKPAWTLFLTGPSVRTWGFHCPRGWISWREFVKADSPGEPGPGCGESS